MYYIYVCIIFLTMNATIVRKYVLIMRIFLKNENFPQIRKQSIPKCLQLGMYAPDKV